MSTNLATSNLVATPTHTGASVLRQRRELLDSIGACRRFAASFVVRTQRGEGGLAELAAVAQLRRELDESIDLIARHLMAFEDCSFREIGAALGISQQAAVQRYPRASSRPAGGQRAGLR